MTLVAPEFRPLVGIYEPSAVQQLADGRFLVVEDEKDHPFSLLTVDATGSVGSRPLELAPDARDVLGKLNDLEGVTADRAGWIYAATSHSRNDAGEEKRSRERLVRFRLDGDRVVAPGVVTGLKAALTSAFPLLAAAAALGDVKAAGGLNIEAIEITPDGQRLLVGFRSPLAGPRALVASIANPAAMFETGEPPRPTGDLIELDLGGLGIRALAHVPVLDGYLVVAGPVATAQTPFQLWLWPADGVGAPRRLGVAGLAGFEHAEGVCAAAIGGRHYVLMVSDDGSRALGRWAQYLLLPTEFLAGG